MTKTANYTPETEILSNSVAEKTKTMTKCTCGSVDFTGDIDHYYNADLLEDGTLSIRFQEDNGISTIICTECEKEYSVFDFKDIVKDC